MRHIFLVVLLSALNLSPAWADSRFTVRDGEVYDSQTKLTWARCSVGQEWKDGHCTGTVSYFDFDEAQKQASGKWRLPTKDELFSLVDPQQKKFPTLDAAAFPDMDAKHPWYWSSTTNGQTIAWYVDFSNGYTSGFIAEANRMAVRLVRSGE